MRIWLRRDRPPRPVASRSKILKRGLMVAVGVRPNWLSCARARISLRRAFHRRLAPDFKTIANFRRDNGSAIRAVCGQFVELCRRLNLFTKAIVAIDGSKFKAVNNRDKNFTVTKVAKRMQQVDASIERYLAALDRADRDDSDIAEAKTSRIQDKIAGLRRQMQALKAMEQQVHAAPDKQVSLTDPDARSMATSGRGTGMVGYNVQFAHYEFHSRPRYPK